MQKSKHYTSSQQINDGIGCPGWEDVEAECKNCDWSGDITECVEDFDPEDGISYYCPACKEQFT